ATAASGIVSNGGFSTIALGDYDNDGAFDLFIAGGAEPVLWRNRGDGTFARDVRSSSVAQMLAGVAPASATFVDYDNDGWLDLVVAGMSVGRGSDSSKVFLFRNDRTGRFLDRASLIPRPVRAMGATSLAISDVDDDGDQDLLLIDRTGAPRLLRNDLGNSNLAVNVSLKALGTGSGKNNSYGIGARLELRGARSTRAVLSRC